MKVCSDCIKNDVCNVKNELERAVIDITDIKERVNVFIDVNVDCQKFFKKQQAYRSSDICG